MTLGRRITADDLAKGSVTAEKVVDGVLAASKLATTVPVANPDQDAATYFDVIDLLHAEQTNMAAASSGQALFAYFTAPRSFTVDQITFCTRATAASGLTVCRYAFYTAAANGDLTIVARTANDTSLLIAVNTAYPKAFDTTGGYPATYSLVKGTKYAVGVLCVGTTMPTLLGCLTLSTINTGVRRRSGLKGGQTDLDANIATISDDGRVPWVSLRKA